MQPSSPTGGNRNSGCAGFLALFVVRLGLEKCAVLVNLGSRVWLRVGLFGREQMLTGCASVGLSAARKIFVKREAGWAYVSTTVGVLSLLERSRVRRHGCVFWTRCGKGFVELLPHSPRYRARATSRFESVRSKGEPRGAVLSRRPLAIGGSTRTRHAVPTSRRALQHRLSLCIFWVFYEKTKLRCSGDIFQGRGETEGRGCCAPFCRSRRGGSATGGVGERWNPRGHNKPRGGWKWPEGGRRRVLGKPEAVRNRRAETIDAPHPESRDDKHVDSPWLVQSFCFLDGVDDRPHLHRWFVSPSSCETKVAAAAACRSWWTRRRRSCRSWNLLARTRHAELWRLARLIR